MYRVSVIVTFSVAVMAAFAEPSQVEPVFEGKRLSHWLDEYERSIPGPEWEGNKQFLIRAEKAVRSVGTNALPWLLQELAAKEPTSGDKLPTNFYSGTAIKRRWLAAMGFAILGESAKFVTSNLVQLFDDRQTSYTAAIALG